MEKEKVTSKDLQTALAAEIEILVKEEKEKLIKRALKRIRKQSAQ